MRKNMFRGVVLTITAILLLAGCTNPNTLRATFPASEPNVLEETGSTSAEDAASEPVTEAPSSDAETAEETIGDEDTSEAYTSEENVSEEVTVAEESEVGTAEPETTPAPAEAETTQAPVTVISVTGKANGTHYIGDTLSAVDLEIIVSMSDGTTLTNPAGFEVSPLTLSAANNTLTCSYGGVSSTFTVAAAERPTEAPTTPEPATEEIRETAGTVDFDALRSAAVGGFITLGRYEQDNNFENGMEAIEWLVLEKQEDKMLVISRYCLDETKYNQFGGTWENSAMRSWLTETFFSYSSFTPEEEALILETVVKTEDRDVSVVTSDRVFILSIEEVKRYFPDDASRKCLGTPLCVGYKDNAGYCFWWIRTNWSWGAYVFYDGSIVPQNADYDGLGVRPAMWIKLTP